MVIKPEMHSATPVHAGLLHWFEFDIMTAKLISIETFLNPEPLPLETALDSFWMVYFNSANRRIKKLPEHIRKLFPEDTGCYFFINDDMTITRVTDETWLTLCHL